MHVIKTVCTHLALVVTMFPSELDTYIFFLTVRQDPLLGASEMFNSFLRKAQQVQTIMCCNVSNTVCEIRGVLRVFW